MWPYEVTIENNELSPEQTSRCLPGAIFYLLINYHVMIPNFTGVLRFGLT